MEEINVEKIMEEIRADIKSKGYSDEQLSFSPSFHQDNFASSESQFYYFRSEELRQIIDLANASWNYPLASWTFQGKIGKIKKLVYIPIRIITRPFISSQRKMNFTFVRAFNQMLGYISMQQKQSEELKIKIETLENKINNLEKID